MTVQDLIAKLQTMPPDAVVIQNYHSDYDLLDDDKPELWKAEDHQICLRGGRLIWYNPKQWPDDEKPVFISCVLF